MITGERADDLRFVEPCGYRPPNRGARLIQRMVGTIPRVEQREFATDVVPRDIWRNLQQLSVSLLSAARSSGYSMASAWLSGPELSAQSLDEAGRPPLYRGFGTDVNQLAQ